MADYRTSIDYAMNFGMNDPFYDMLRRRLLDQIAGQTQGQQQYAMGRLESRGLGQSGAVGQTLSSIAGGGLQALGQGAGQIGAEQSRQRFSLLQDAIQREAAKPGFWDVASGLTGAAGQVLPMILGAPSPGMAQTLNTKRQQADWTPTQSYFSKLNRYSLRF